MVMKMRIRTYSELITLPTFMARYNYLRITGQVGEATFGGRRYLNQLLYKTDMWGSIRNKVIVRDNGCDLGIPGREIISRITVHHIDPITIDDILERNPKVFDMDNLITTADMTHKAIHYGDSSLLAKEPIIRHAYDTCPWKH